MKTAILALIGFGVATLAVFIPGVRATRPATNASQKDQIFFYAKKYKKQIGVFGGLLGAIAAFWGSYEQDKAQATIVGKSDTIARLNREMLQRQSLSDEASIRQYKKLLDQAIGQRDQMALLLEEERILRLKTEKIENLQSRLNTRSDKIADLSEQLYNSTTGKGSFCYIQIMPTSSTKAEIMLKREGNYPIQGLEITIWNPEQEFALLTLRAQQIDVTDEQYEKMTSIIQHFKVGMIPVTTNVAFNIGSIPYSLPRDSSLRVNFKALNGFWMQFISMKKNVNGRYVQSSNVSMRTFEKGRPKQLILKESSIQY